MNTMNDAEFNGLLESAQRRKLTFEEEARLQALLDADPRARAIWAEEMALSRLLDRLPDAPVASNFTAQVLRTVERDSERRGQGRQILRWFGWRRPSRPFATACLAALLVALGLWQYQSIRRQRMALALHNLARNIDTPPRTVGLAPVELWKDFDAINRLPQGDEELLAVLKEVAMK
jgi:anti-sigma factor RsiW